jgi:hypothetical protein
MYDIGRKPNHRPKYSLAGSNTVFDVLMGRIRTSREKTNRHRRNLLDCEPACGGDGGIQFEPGWWNSLARGKNTGNFELFSASNAPYDRRILETPEPSANIGRRLNATRTGNFGAGSGNIGPQNAELRNGNGTRTHLINPFTPDSWSLN